jgi:hypothetical protein
MTDNTDIYADGLANTMDTLAYMAEQNRHAGADFIEEFIAANRIARITPIPATTIGDVDFPLSYSLVIGNNIYDGPTIADCVAQSVGRV